MIAPILYIVDVLIYPLSQETCYSSIGTIHKYLESSIGRIQATKLAIYYFIIFLAISKKGKYI